MWEWLNGKKTIIGAALIFLSMAITEADKIYCGSYSLMCASDWLKATSDYVNWLGIAVGSLGVAHKMAKERKRDGTDPTP